MTTAIVVYVPPSFVLGQFVVFSWGLFNRNSRIAMKWGEKDLGGGYQWPS